MPPTAKAVGFTLSGSTASTRPVANQRSILRPITTAPAAWHKHCGMLAGLLVGAAIAQP